MKVDGGAAQSSSWLLLAFCLKGIFAGDWSVHLPPSPICAVTGSSVVLQCSYDFPQSSNETKGEGRPSSQDGGGGGEQYNVSSEMWCLEDSRCITPQYVFHSAGIFQDPSYQDRVEYMGQPGTRNCSLRISDVRPSDSGTYVFYIITNHPTQKMPEQSGVQLLVTDSPSTVTVLVSPSEDITEGGVVHLACCNPAAGPQAHFSWYKSSNPKQRHAGQVWTIREVTSDDSGSYYCRAQAGDKEQTSSMLLIDVQYAPRNTAVSVSRAGEPQDKALTLTCSSDANPPVRSYTWYQGAACLPTADRSFYTRRTSLATPVGGGPTLSSANISVEEYGQHCCVARNRHGSQSDGVTINSLPETAASDSAGGKLVLVGITVGVLLVIVAVVAFIMSRKQRASRNQSYVLTETETSTAP